jgi:predicted nucleic acid-binding protein
MAAADVAGGAAWDGLIAATARAHDATLLTLDRRALPTYRAVGARLRLLGA